jgi:plasmid stabilization system protein ParE
MSYQVRFTGQARQDLLRLFGFLADEDYQAAVQAREAIGRAVEFLSVFPFTCRKATPSDPFLRELLIPFGRSGYVALFEIEGGGVVTVLAVRHQREEDYY